MEQKLKVGILGATGMVGQRFISPVSYTHLRAHETDSYLVCRLLLEKKNKTTHCRQILALEHKTKHKRPRSDT